MKGSFIKIILEFIGSSDSLIPDLFRRESMHYKDLRMQGLDPNKIYKGFYNLKRRGLVNKYGDTYKFTNKGLSWLRNSSLRYFKLKTKKWDKKWRIVIFDIPSEFHKNRIYLRKKLLNLGFFPLQKSVYVYPYPCEEELGYICQKLKIGDYVDIIQADTVGFKEEEIKKFFNL